MSVLNVFGMSIFQNSSARCLYLALLPKSYSSIYEAIALCGTRCVIIDIQAWLFTRVNSLRLQSQCLAITAFCKASQKDKFHLSFGDRCTVSSIGIELLLIVYNSSSKGIKPFNKEKSPLTFVSGDFMQFMLKSCSLRA